MPLLLIACAGSRADDANLRETIDSLHAENRRLRKELETYPREGREPPFGFLQVKSQPPFAELLVNGRYLAQTPMAGPKQFPAGRVRIQIRHPKHSLYDTVFTLHAGETSLIHVDLRTRRWKEKIEREIQRPPPATRAVQPGRGFHHLACETLDENVEAGLLTVTSVPASADLLVDGTFCMKTPQEDLRLPAGPHKLTLRHPLWPTRDTSIYLVAGTRKSIRVALGPPAADSVPPAGRTCFLLVKSKPAFAELRINGRVQGETPMNAYVELLAGKVKLELVHRTVEPYETTFVVEAGERRSIRVDMETRRMWLAW